MTPLVFGCTLDQYWEEQERIDANWFNVILCFSKREITIEIQGEFIKRMQKTISEEKGDYKFLNLFDNYDKAADYYNENIKTLIENSYVIDLNGKTIIVP